MLMMLDIADAPPLILEGSGRRTELQIPMMLALLFTRRGPSRRSDGYRNRTRSNRNGRNHGVGRGVDDRDGAPAGTGYVGSGPIWCNGYPRSTAHRNGRNHRVGRGVDDRDNDVLLIGHVGSGSVGRDGDLRRASANKNRRNDGV